MKYKRLILMPAIGLLVAVLMLAGATSPASAQQTQLDGRSFYNVNIRTAPGTHRPIIGLIPASAEFVAVGRTEDNTWLQVEYEETIGWSAAWLFSFDKDTIDLPVTNREDDIPPASEAGTYETLIPYNMNLRAAPTVHAEVLTEIPYTSNVVATGRDSTNSWVLVDYDGQTGWVALWPIVLLGDISQLPQESGPVSVAPTATTAPESTTEPASVTGITVEAPYDVNLHTSPSVDSGVVITLPFTAAGEAVGRNAGNNWIEVTHDGQTGWVASWIVTLSDNPINLPVTSDNDDVTAYSGELSAQAVFNLVIRANPAERFAALGQVPAGETIILEARSDNSSWVKITYQDVTGWVGSWLMIADGDINNLPVEIPTP